MRNLILTQYLLYGKHIGLSTGGPRDHIKNHGHKNDDTFRLNRHTWPPKYGIISNGGPQMHAKLSSNSIRTTWLSTWSRISQNNPRWLANVIQMNPKWPPSGSRLMPKSLRNTCINESRYNAFDRTWLEGTSKAGNHKQTHGSTNPLRRNSWLLINECK